MGQVHAKVVPDVGAQVACTGSVVEVLFRINDEQGIGRGKEWDGLGCVGIPHDLSCFLDSHVVGDGVGGTVQTTRGDNVHVRGCHGQRGVVPDESRILSDPEVCCGCTGRGDHGDATGTGGRVDRDGSSRGCLALRLTGALGVGVGASGVGVGIGVSGIGVGVGSLGVLSGLGLGGAVGGSGRGGCFGRGGFGGFVWNKRLAWTG